MELNLFYSYINDLTSLVSDLTKIERCDLINSMETFFLNGTVRKIKKCTSSEIIKEFIGLDRRYDYHMMGRNCIMIIDVSVDKDNMELSKFKNYITSAYTSKYPVYIKTVKNFGLSSLIKLVDSNNKELITLNIYDQSHKKTNNIPEPLRYSRRSPDKDDPEYLLNCITERTVEKHVSITVENQKDSYWNIDILVIKIKSGNKVIDKNFERIKDYYMAQREISKIYT